MTIIVKSAGKFEGIHYFANSTLSLPSDLELRMVNDGFAIWQTQPDTFDNNVRVRRGPDRNIKAIANPDDTDATITAPISITGVFQFGQTLTAVLQPGWTVTGFQWLRNGADISGATNSTYTMVAADIGNSITVKGTGLAYTGQDGEAVQYVGAPLLRVASPYNRSATELLTASGADVEMAFRLFRPVGSANKKKLSIRLDNWYFSSATAISPGGAISYPYGIGLEINGITVPLTINGQPLTNYTLAAGAFNIRPDLLDASQFGLAQFSRGTSVRVRGTQRGKSIPVAGAVDLQDVCRQYNPELTTCTNPLGTGTLTFSGTNPTSTTVPFITLIGEDVDSSADARSWWINADSIGWQSSTQSYPMAALEGANIANQLISGVMLGRSGGDAAVVNNHPNEIGSFAELTNGMIDLYGTNSILNATPATIISRSRGNWAIFRARKSAHPFAKNQFIARMPLLMKGLQGDPVITNGWNASQDAETLTDLYAAQVGIDGGCDVFVDTLTTSPYLIRASATGKGTTDSDFYKYKTGSSTDKIHPTAAGASGINGLGANLRPVLLANA